MINGEVVAVFLCLYQTRESFEPEQVDLLQQKTLPLPLSSLPGLN